MKLILIKIGKAINVIKRDGIIKGTQRIWKAFRTLFKRVGEGEILYVTGGVGDSALYRAHHQAEELNLNDFKCSVTVQDNPLLPKYSNKFKVFIFHRVLYTKNVKKLIENIKKEGKEIIFETDDLVFDPKYLKDMDYFNKMNNLERKLYENGVGGEILRDSYVKVCTTTTSFLAEKLRQEDKKVFISKNKLSEKDLNGIEKILKKKKEKMKDDKIKLGYFSGTISHNKDFATINEALVRIMSQFHNVELFLVGPLDLENSLVKKFKNRIVQLPYVPREKHFENISKVDINLAPLEIGNPFCESKSELKFFEAGVLGVPTVAAATQVFKETIKDGEDGFVAKDSNEWENKIKILIENSELRKKMGEKARKKTLQEYTNKNSHNREYYNYLREIL